MTGLVPEDICSLSGFVGQKVDRTLNLETRQLLADYGLFFVSFDGLPVHVIRARDMICDAESYFNGVLCAF